MIDFGSEISQIVQTEKRKRILNWNIFKRIRCFLTSHKWTCDVHETISPCTELKYYIEREPEKGFDIYATMYCKHCGHISKLSKDRLNEH